MMINFESNWAEGAPVELLLSWKMAKMTTLRSITYIRKACVLARVLPEKQLIEYNRLIKRALL